MRRAYLLIALVLGCATALPAAGQQLFGSGSTFVYPVLAKWSEAYQKVSGTQVAYQPVGSSGGLREIRGGAVDFGVSDAPLDGAQLLRDGLVQFPVVIGAIVPVVNLDGITAGQLRFTGPLLADIFLGKVTNWSHPSIAAVNPGIELPDLAILVIHRSDGSGTTHNWADYLSKVSGEWKVRVGASTLVGWPTGVGGKGNNGVAEYVTRVRGAIGYVEYGSAQRNKMAYALVQNKAGNFVLPDTASFQAATADLDWTKLREATVSLTDSPKADAYPIMAASFALIRKYPKDVGRSRNVLAFFRWALESGQVMATALDYLPLPPLLVQEVETYWKAELDPGTNEPSLTRDVSRAPG